MNKDETEGLDVFSENMGRRLSLQVHPHPILQIPAAPVDSARRLGCGLCVGICPAGSLSPSS